MQCGWHWRRCNRCTTSNAFLQIFDKRSNRYFEHDYPVRHRRSLYLQVGRHEPQQALSRARGLLSSHNYAAYHVSWQLDRRHAHLVNFAAYLNPDYA